MKLSVYKILEKTKVEGPGLRFCIWVQGCSRHCKGCYAKNTWDKSKGKIFNTDNLFERIKSQKNIEGVTFLGGEPFEQAEALGILAQKCKSIGLSVLTFTGGNYEDLRAQNDKNINLLLDNTDLLIDGKFDEKKLDYSRAWVGSSNQRYLFLSDRYNEDDIKKYKNKVEIHFEKSGKIFINGMGDFDKIAKDLALLND
ncbi:MAG: radical SAM protein [bacterium]|nr:radical SAM protein [bacterium]